MATYIHLFENDSEYNNYIDNSYLEPSLSATKINGGDETPTYRVNYNLTEYEKLLKMPLTFEINSDGVINWFAHDTEYTCTIEYSKNGGEWASITSNTGSSAPSISVVSGDTVQFRGDNAVYGDYHNDWENYFGGTAMFEVEGNIMSLIGSTGYTTATTLSSAYTFYYLFQNCTGLTSAENLILNATTLSPYCYYGMFEGCTGLTTAPELPATTLVSRCYYNMFRDCTNLNYIKCLATDISAASSTNNWVNGVAANGTFVKDASMTSWTTSVNGIPNGWTVEDAN